MAQTGVQSRATSRIVYRGNTASFKADFFEDAAKVIPMTPSDPTQYPGYNIISPAGVTVQSGVASMTAPGYYTITWPVAVDVQLSTASSRWRVEWIMVTQNNRQIPFIWEFDVADRIISTIDSNELEFLALENRPFTVRIPLTTQPHALTCTVSDANNSATVVASGNLTLGINMAASGDMYVYYLEIPVNTLLGGYKYTAVWAIQDTIDSIEDHVFQVIAVVPHRILQYIPDLRTLVDRLQKRLNWPQAYQDSHLINFLGHGLRLLNSHHPYTTWAYTDIPGPAVTFWLLYSGVYALQSQYLLENDLAMEYSGQETTLTYDRTGNIDAAIGRMADYINEHLTPAKMSVVRMQRGVGAYAGRPVRFTAIQNLVFRLATYSSTDFCGLLTQFGLI